MPKERWNQIEMMQKHLITGFLRVKISTTYEILLAETDIYAIYLDTVRRMIL